MQECDTIIYPDKIIHGNDLKIIKKNAIAIKDKKIIAIDEDDTIRNNYYSHNTYNLPTSIISPGFINCHTHIAMNLFKSFVFDLPLSIWLQDYIWPAEGRFLSEEFVYDGSMLAIVEMIKCGTTCFNDMYFYPDKTADATILAGLKAVMGMVVIDYPSKWANNSFEYIQKGLSFLDKYKKQNLIKTSFAPHSLYALSANAWQNIATIANELDLTVHTHLNETQQENALFIKKYKITPLQKLKELELLNKNLIAVHMTHFNKQEEILIKNNPINVVHCPLSNAALSCGYCDVTQLKKLNSNVVVGTDGAASNYNLDMIQQMRSVGMFAKLVTKDATNMPAYEIYKMATVNAAKALQLENSGFLQVGMDADMIAIDTKNVNTYPCYDELSSIVYSACSDQITFSWVQGRLLMEDRKLITIDEDEVLSKVAFWQEKIKNEK
jgi:5-methylthioadenosine/S-adenosylhomocysteine deaminase